MTRQAPTHPGEFGDASPYTRHVPALDGIRCSALVAVMASHLFPGTASGRTTLFIQHLLSFGATGVDLFFVLSGFLITGILYDSLGDPYYFRKFYARRALRIFPIYYGVLAVYAICSIGANAGFYREMLSLGLYLHNTWLIAPPIWRFIPESALPLSHFWSLAVEEQFYLVWPLIVFLVRTRKRLLLVCVAAIFVCPAIRLAFLMHGIDGASIHANTLCRADSLLAGGALSLLLRSRVRERVIRLGPWLLLAGVLTQAFYFEGIVPGAGHAMSVLNYTTLMTMYSGLLLMTFSGGAVQAFFSWHPFRWVGKYSYGAYIFHAILMSYLSLPLHLFFHKHLTDNKGVVVLLVGLVIMALTLLAAYVSYNFYERHFLKLKRYFDYRQHPDTVS